DPRYKLRSITPEEKTRGSCETRWIKISLGVEGGQDTSASRYAPLGFEIVKAVGKVRTSMDRMEEYFQNCGGQDMSASRYAPLGFGIEKAVGKVRTSMDGMQEYFLNYG
ncbi:hypothetical protein CEXT_567561, partial [Caerostris extrusa]